MASTIKDGDVESTVSNANKVAPDVNQDTEGCHVETKTDHSTDDVPSLIPPLSSSTSTTSSTSTHKKTKGKDYAEISPNKRYIRFKERFSNTANIKASYRGFDTKNGIEVVWQKIYLSDLGETEQEPIMRSLNYLKDIQQKHIVEYLSVWVTEAPRTVNLITTYLDPLETFIAKVKTLRWRIIKKWCKQLLTGLHYLHSSNPVIVHRNLNLGNIFMNGGLGEIYLGGLWLSAVLVEGEESVSMSDLVSTYCYQGRQPGSPAYKAPEVLLNQPLTTKVDIYSFGMCLLVLLTKEDPYIEIYGAHLNNESGDSDGHTSNDRKSGYDAIASLIRNGVLPKALDRVSEAKSEAGAFLRSCLALDPRDRKSAEELLEDDFLQQSSGDGGDDNVVIKKIVDEFPMDDVGSVVKENEDISMSDRFNGDNPSAVNDAMTDCVHVDSSSVVVVPLPDIGPPVNISQSPTKNTTTIMSNIVIPSLEANDSHVSFSETSTDQGIDIITSKSDNSIEPFLVVDDKSVIEAKDEAEQSSELIEAFNDKLVSKLDDSNISSEGSPRLESASHVAKRMSLVNELAKLGTSDDVNDDRGIHDGRRARNSSEKNKSTKGVKTPKQLPVQSVMNSSEPSHTTSSEVEMKDSGSAVLVQLHIHGRYTSDGINKEVEFVFDKASDQVEVIASEMKDELHLNLSVERLVSLIHEEISQGVTRRMSDPISPSSESTNCQTAVSNKTESSAESNKSDYQAREVSDVMKRKGESENIAAVVLSSPGSPRHSEDNVDATEVSSMVSLTVSTSYSNDDDAGDHSITELQSKIVEQVVNLGVNIDHLPVNDKAGSSITNNIVQQNIGSEPVSPNVKSEDGVPLSISPTNSSVSRVEVPMPDEDTSPEEMADYHVYVKEIEAIEKESRAARRVFEQRIQKHKIIQMTCKEDLQKMELDYSTQQSKLLNKKNAAEKKKTDELTRLRSELDKNLLELKHNIAKRRLHRKMQFQFRQEDMVHQPLFVESDEFGPTDSFADGTHSIGGEPKSFTSTENIDQYVVETGVTTSSTTLTGGSVDSGNGHSPDIRKQIPQIHDHDVQYIHVNGGGNYREEDCGRNGSSSSSSSSDSSRRSSGGDQAGQKVIGEKEFVDGDGSSSVCTKGNDLSVIVDNSAGI